MIWHQDLPIGSSSIFAQWEVMKLASAFKMKVLLDGQGADETLGGYSLFTGFYLIDLIKKFKLISFIKNIQFIKENRSVRPINELSRAAFYYLPNILQKTIRNKSRIGSKFISAEFLNEYKDEPTPYKSMPNYLDMSIEIIKYGLHELLRYEDRNSMAFSIESRVPFLDHRLVEFSLALDNELKLKNGWTKFILRKAIDKNLPKQITWRKDKKGFVTPQNIWKKELQPNLLDFLTNSKSVDFINMDYLLKSVNNNISSKNHLSEFWKIISVIKWKIINFN